jgi:hypothetical protein
MSKGEGAVESRGVTWCRTLQRSASTVQSTSPIPPRNKKSYCNTDGNVQGWFTTKARIDIPITLATISLLKCLTLLPMRTDDEPYNTRKHTRVHTQGERERERERVKGREIEKGKIIEIIK